jgi:reprolysin-like metallo-peptidase family M12B
MISRIVIPFLSFALWLSPQLVSAQATSPDRLWQRVNKIPTAPANARADIQPTKFKTFTLDWGKLRATLTRAPLEFTTRLGRDTGLQITLPMPNGTFARFQIEESPVMEAPLAVKYPQIKSYRGRGIDDRAALLRFDVNGKTFHAQILSPSGTVYIDPYWQHDGRLYMSYAKSDLQNDAREFHCLVEGKPLSDNMREALENLRGAGSGTALHTYRLACATSITYSQYHGGMVPVVADVLAALVTMVNRVSGVYETEFAIKLVLVANNDLIIASATNPTPFTDTPGDIFSNPPYIDSKIGENNYDIGHVVTTGSGGIAGLGVVCAGFNVASGGSDKAAGTTGINPPVGDGFWIDFVAHEMGHQFGANHPFNGDGTNCGAANQNPSTAYEPGSGSTIMAYAGICGAANDLQPHSDPYFHFISLEEIFGYSIVGPGGACPVQTPTGDNPPTVSARADGVAAFPAVAYKIPDQTSFSLTAHHGMDPDGDPITYCWEESDLGPQKAGTAPDNGSSALFRSFIPTTSPTRTFPRWPDLITNNNQNIGEKLPLTTRKLDFKVTVRDNRGGWGTDLIRLNVVNSGTGFAVTSPNTAVTYAGGSTQTVTWDVAGTTANGINTSLVNILLTTDATPASGDPTFPIVLAANTPNDGSESVTIPMVNTSKARIMVQAVGNVYFDVSNTNFTITAPAPQLVSVVSRKTHGGAGTFDINLPLTGPPFGIECRTGGATNDYTFVFTFANPLINVGSPSVSVGAVKASSAVNPGDSTQYILDVGGVTSGQYLTVALNNVNGDGTSGPVIAGMLVGDTTGNGAVNSTDIGQSKLQSGIPVSAVNFRNDVAANGVINSSDVSSVKLASGTALP